MTQYSKREVTIDLTTQLSIDGNIKVKIVNTQNNNSAKLAFTAPHSVLILRKEIVGKTPKK
ncbi:hypothetical protein CWC48_14205 [Pseudomonas sp. S10E 269]|jgi:sRNA-binding carbon storage regulator CsrA|uniref:carbon storage regulator n=1 Tax=Pseudomonas TaxID=286 RepID=UPI000C25A38A|nr:MULTISPECIES: carbon storage regulator [Pseudomonas]MDR6165570.1 sRNA-binding carbon storage regulator CsrA [Pseudomonas fluorescens]PJK36302.1 hypothetical protein CWC49_24355 [Pseudomonas sp. S09F 262]PJK40247.1 hypothetical protein CWC48_14205 [Pseudomonas sp. S10E 269]